MVPVDASYVWDHNLRNIKLYFRIQISLLVVNFIKQKSAKNEKLKTFALMPELAQKCKTILKQNYSMKLLITYTLTYYCCSCSQVGNFDLVDFLQKSFITLTTACCG